MTGERISSGADGTDAAAAQRRTDLLSARSPWGAAADPDGQVLPPAFTDPDVRPVPHAALDPEVRRIPHAALDPDGRGVPHAAPAHIPLTDASGPREGTTRLTAHGCWYPSADPAGAQVAFICDRGGVPQLWAGPVDGGEVRLLDAGPDPVREVSWSPDGRWIAYTTAPGGGEHSRVLCVRPDGTDRRILAGAEPGTTAYLGCWAHDGSAVAVTVAVPTGPPVDAAAPAAVGHGGPGSGLPPGWSGRGGDAVLLGPIPLTTTEPRPTPRADAPVPAEPRSSRIAALLTTAPYGRAASAQDDPRHLRFTATAGFGDGLSAYLIDPDGAAAPVLLATEQDAATLRVCDLSPDGGLALLRRGPRGRREAVVVRTTDLTTTCVVPVADGDPWIGRFSPQADTLWLRSDAEREFAALIAARLDDEGRPGDWSVAVERAGSELELLAFADDGHTAVLAWNVRGASETEIVDLPASGTPTDGVGAPRPVPLPHEVVTRIVGAGRGRLLLALSGSQRRPGVWWLSFGVELVRTPWSSRDEDAVPPGRSPVRPVPVGVTARDGLALHGWYYRAPGRGPGEPAPCVIHLHGGPEEQERPVFNPLYHEILGRGLDIFAPDVRGSSGHGRSFVDADLGRGRFAALDDVADCAAHAVLAGPADPARLAVMGRSYGGYLTFASLVWHPDLFRTGVAVCGMSDFATFFEGTEPWIAQSAAHKYGHPERDSELLRSLSPMTRIDALRVPVLAVHGEHDTNVPPRESEQFVRAARERGRAAELLTLRNEGHDFLRADNRRLFRRAAADWLQRHLVDRPASG
ncbi:prolyl oligopeptidase family serine peptidase [Streptomyces sp. NPDC049915]|uniref:prolyl oligopeptidase family serine peptidase n=1 Tax=Streptomyces sp. NPDC049915 TaxID=3155510 RepID=UPI003439787A